MRSLLAVLIHGIIAVSCSTSYGQTVSAPGLPTTTPDPGQITVRLNYPTAGAITSMELFFQFTHPCERDLSMDLVAPDGYTVNVFAGGANTCSGIAQTSSSDNTLIGQPQFFGGHQAKGVWKLVVTDNTAGYEGTLDVFRLTMTVEGTTTRTAPYDFFVGCNDSSEAASFGSQAAAIGVSNPIGGTFDLNVQAAGLVATAAAQAGVGIVYTPTFTGDIIIGATVQVRPPSADIVYSTGIPKIGQSGVASLTSAVFISVTPPVDSIETQVFRAAITTPIGGVVEVHEYNPAENFTFYRTVAVTMGQQLRICAGIRSQASVTGLPLGFTLSKGVYTSNKVVSIKIIPQ